MRNCPPLTAAWYRESSLHLATDWCSVAYIHTCLQCPACSLQHAAPHLPCSQQYLVVSYTLPSRDRQL